MKTACVNVLQCPSYRSAVSDPSGVDLEADHGASEEKSSLGDGRSGSSRGDDRAGDGEKVASLETPETLTRRVDLDNVPSIPLIVDFDGPIRLCIFELQGKMDLRQISDLHGYCKF